MVVAILIESKLLDAKSVFFMEQEKVREIIKWIYLRKGGLARGRGGIML